MAELVDAHASRIARRNADPVAQAGSATPLGPHNLRLRPARVLLRGGTPTRLLKLARLPPWGHIICACDLPGFYCALRTPRLPAAGWCDTDELLGPVGRLPIRGSGRFEHLGCPPQAGATPMSCWDLWAGCLSGGLGASKTTSQTPPGGVAAANGRRAAAVPSATSHAGHRPRLRPLPVEWRPRTVVAQPRYRRQRPMRATDHRRRSSIGVAQFASIEQHRVAVSNRSS